MSSISLPSPRTVNFRNIWHEVKLRRALTVNETVGQTMIAGSFDTRSKWTDSTGFWFRFNGSDNGSRKIWGTMTFEGVNVIQGWTSKCRHDCHSSVPTNVDSILLNLSVTEPEANVTQDLSFERFSTSRASVSLKARNWKRLCKLASLLRPMR